jgi:hypothetical protein
VCWKFGAAQTLACTFEISGAVSDARCVTIVAVHAAGDERRALGAEGRAAILTREHVLRLAMRSGSDNRVKVSKVYGVQRVRGLPLNLDQLPHVVPTPDALPPA